MTLETAHFRVHYPAGYEAWTLRLAPRMEAIRRVVTEEVGFAPGETVDVLVMDPYSAANGMVLPFLRYPRMVLWTTPPEPWSPIGHYRDWPELLFLHEEVHAVHLLRPSRGAWGRLIERLLPLGAIGRKAPRWVSEGYATLLEGKLTGVGRPNGDFRAAVLRKWAVEGNLPSYGQMASDGESWLGMSMAYLMGSAYMEWLAERTDEGGWKRLWARLTAKRDRSFDAAFEGVFGEGPAKLYDRFTAELTWRAKELERTMEPVLAEGELWQDTAWTTGEPALSPDGTRMAIVLRAKDEPSRLVVWNTQPDPEAQKKWDESVERIKREDPEDFPGVRTKPFPATELFRMPLSVAREPMAQRWMPDGKSILFTSFEPDIHGFTSPDLFLWTPETGDVRRVTKGARVKEADPFPDGKRALAVHSRFGFTRLAAIDLATGGVEFLTEPSLEMVWAQPRVSPDGSRAAALRHTEGRWDLVHFNPGPEGALQPAAIALPEGAVPMFPAWAPDGRSVFASVGRGGFIDIHVSDPALEAMTAAVTRTRGAAFAPAPTPDGKGLFYLSLEPDGLEVRTLAFDAGAGAAPETEGDPAFAPAVRPVPPAAIEFQEEAIAEPRPYGAGRQEFSLLFGGHWTAYTRAWEAGVRGGDVLGRFNYFIAGGGGEDGAPRGGTFALGWRGWPVEVTAQIYDVEQYPTKQKGWPYWDSPDASPRHFDRNRQGAVITLSKDWILRRGRAGLVGGGLWEDVGHFRKEHGPDRRFVYLETSAAHFHPFGGWETLASLSIRREWGETEAPESLAGWTGNRWEGWTRNQVELRGGIRKGSFSLVVSYERRAYSGVGITIDGLVEITTFGGVETSLLPRAAQFDAVLHPAFMRAQWSGDRYEGWKAHLTAAGLPLFYERFRLWFDGPSEGEWHDLAGFEWDLTSGPLALVRMPGFRLTLGGAYLFDAPLEGKTRLWLGLAWRP